MSEISEAQLAANRANGALSTRPRTGEGQKRSSRNAMEHGLTGCTVLLPPGKRPDYDAFSQEIFNQLKPASPMEREKVQLIVDQLWRLRRAAAIENGLMGMMDPEVAEEIEIDTGVVRQLATLASYVQRIQRVLREAQKQLEEMQRVRRTRGDRQMAPVITMQKVKRQRSNVKGQK